MAEVEEFVEVFAKDLVVVVLAGAEDLVEVSAMDFGVAGVTVEATVEVVAMGSEVADIECRLACTACKATKYMGCMGSCNHLVVKQLCHLDHLDLPQEVVLLVGQESTEHLLVEQESMEH